MTQQSPYATIREASQIMGISEGKIMQLIQDKKLQAYRIAGQYLRLKKTDVIAMRDSGDIAAENIKFPYAIRERFRDFFVYNDFYIVSFIIIIILIGVIFLG